MPELEGEPTGGDAKPTVTAKFGEPIRVDYPREVHEQKVAEWEESQRIIGAAAEAVRAKSQAEAQVVTPEEEAKADNPDLITSADVPKPDRAPGTE